MDRLLEDVKNFLDITWEMELGERKKLSGIIERGKAFLKGKIGQCDFEGETPEKDLLLNYCMYARAGQVDEFVKNYKQEIIALQIHNWRKKNAKT
ncbi:hypothetical protein EDD74_13437 [Faecalimonas umbilicata]|jgi:hypothetical protein|uniref:Uncharacterized protein n=2 Tax=root TaxID=1 RepID=A0A4R3J9G4_9FIRM|nr:hypothetical protein [Faecalimonas umbilicata]TCS62045.1 hypothetical protein EDD74_13437 [Faecalimonas umbilicata]GBU05183.1 hypothetical protein FAEUMB_17240 [Faecalimonas umbilicata]DAD99420.1 MAG TPA: Head Tail Connector Protein [Siphoviridae sp. ctNU74]DAZ45499.1 MAG TPA: Head Tail Connector Protein [Caudoviricetes sp.]